MQKCLPKSEVTFTYFLIPGIGCNFKKSTKNVEFGPRGPILSKIRISFKIAKESLFNT